MLATATAADLLGRARILFEEVEADPTPAAQVERAAELVALSRRQGAAEAQVLALRAQAYAEGSRFANDRAKALLDKAVRQAKAAGLDRQLVRALLSRSGVTSELGRLEAAQRDLDAVRLLAVDGELADFHLQQAGLFHNTGRLAEAAAMYRLVLADTDASAPIRAMTANNLGCIEVTLGQFAAAIEHLELATDLAATCTLPIRAGVATTRSWVVMQAGRLTESLALFDAATDQYLDGNLPLGSHYLEYVDALIDLRLLAEGRELAERAVDELERSGVTLMAAEGQVRLARLALLQGDPSAAVTAASVAAARFARQRRPAWAARATTILVDAQVRLGQLDASALTKARRAAARLEQLQLRSQAVEAHLVAGRAAVRLRRKLTARQHFRSAQQLVGTTAPVLLRLQGNLAGALSSALDDEPSALLRHCRDGLEDLARHRDAFASLELRVLASGHGAELGRLGLDVLLRTGTPRQVFGWMERTRAAALEAIRPVSGGGLENELAELRSVQVELDALEVAGENGGDPAAVSRSALLLGRQKSIEQQIRRATWKAQSTQPRHWVEQSPAALRRLLDGRTLVEFAVFDGHLIAAVLTSRRIRIFRLGRLDEVQRHIDLLLFALRRLSQPGRSGAAVAAARAGADAALGALRRLLLGEMSLEAAEPIVVVAVGALQRVPWSALHDGPVAVAPSASFWAATLRREHTGGSVLLVAGPHLPGAVAEVTALQHMHPGATLLVPPASTVGAVTQALSGAELAHLACHGRLRSDNPSFSALQLSDGSLTVHELDTRGIAPHRIVLATCDSAADISFEGNELLGFVSALMARGTSGLVASIVVVPDATSGALMRALHAGLLAGDTMAEALFAARTGVDLDDPAHFVGWCAFNTYGAG